MKQIEKISLARNPFSVEKDAYDVLCGYLADVESYYSAKEGGQEIIDGIEERMSELFKESTSDNGVIDISLVNEVIGRLGRPDEMDGGEREEEETSGGRPVYSSGKKMFRDKKNKMVFGVCSGLGAYFDVDRAFIRLGFVLLTILGFIFGDFFGPFVLGVPVFYVILAICIPPAVTVEDYCRMSGGRVDISDIEKRIRNSQPSPRRRDSSSAAVSVFRVIAGVIFLIVGISGVLLGSLSMLWAKLGRDAFLLNADSYSLSLYSSYVEPLFSSPLAIFLLYSIVLIPFIGFLYEGILMTFGFKSPKWKPGLIMLILWLVVVIVSLVLISVYFYDLYSVMIWR